MLFHVNGRKVCLALEGEGSRGNTRNNATKTVSRILICNLALGSSVGRNRRRLCRCFCQSALLVSFGLLRTSSPSPDGRRFVSDESKNQSIVVKKKAGKSVLLVVEKGSQAIRERGRGTTSVGRGEQSHP
jgi:hypothetical protein